MGDPSAVAGRRRWPYVVVAAVVLVGSLAALWWFFWVPNWRPSLREGERYGVDVSAHQDVVNWQKVARDDIDFAYIKATEGGDFVDRRFEANWRDSAAAGLDRGAYHFFTFCAPAATQARNFLAVAAPDPGALPPAVDLELAGNCKARPDRPDVDREPSAFLSIVEDAWGREVLLYVGDDWELRYPVRRQFGRLLWHRRFLRRPDVPNWKIWQLHGYARVSGVNGQVDLNVMRTNREALRALKRRVSDAITPTLRHHQPPGPEQPQRALRTPLDSKSAVHARVLAPKWFELGRQPSEPSLLGTPTRGILTG
jgi:lysozyme